MVNMNMKVESINNMTSYGGMALNVEEMRLEWRPENLEENVWGLLGMWGNTLRELDMKVSGEIYEIKTKKIKYYTGDGLFAWDLIRK